MSYPNTRLSTAHLNAFAEAKVDPLAAVAKVPPQPQPTPLSNTLETGLPSPFCKEVWEAIRKAEQATGQATVVNLLANTQLGYLVYEHLGKQLASGEMKIHPTIVNKEGKNVINQDVILQGIIAQLTTYSLNSDHNT